MTVTVVMATSNRAHYLAQAIESVRAQSYADFELIVVDDGSTDSTPELLARYVDLDSRIIALSQPRSGVAAARNLALTRSRFPLVAVMDDDDLMMPDRLAAQTAFLNQNPQFCAVVSYAYLIDAAGRTIGKSAPEVDFDRGRRLRRMDLALDAIHGTAMFRKDAVMRVGAYRLAKLEDRDLLGRLLTAGDDIASLPQFLYKIRRHSQNTSRDLAAESLLLGDFIDYNVIQRLNRAPEASLEAYRARLRSAAPWTRFRQLLRLQARLAYDRATLSYSQRHIAAAVGYGMAAICLRPSRMARRIATKIVWSS